MNFTIPMVVILTFFFAPSVHSQCPDDPKDLLINTQEKEDYFLQNFPNCDQFNFVTVNNRYIGDPRYRPYIISLVGTIILILMLIKGVFFLTKI